MSDTVNEQTATNERLPGHGPRRGRKPTIYLIALTIVTVGMFGFAYANAELFVRICQDLGLLSSDPSRMRAGIVDTEGGRPLDIYFSANVADNLPIAFSVERSYQRVALGKAEMNDYHFRNLSDRTIYFRPVHDVNPVRAGGENVMLLEKCFCFTEQKLEPGQRYTLPVKYAFTDKLDERVSNIRMNYTLFPSTRQAYEASMEAYERTGVVPNHGPGEDE